MIFEWRKNHAIVREFGLTAYGTSEIANRYDNKYESSSIRLIVIIYR